MAKTGHSEGSQWQPHDAITRLPIQVTYIEPADVLAGSPRWLDTLNHFYPFPPSR